MSEIADPYHPVPLRYTRPALEQQHACSREFLEHMRTRRSIRQFSTEPVPFELIANAIAAAGTAPSGANQQPWTFVVIGDASVKREIRAVVEQEERTNYEGRMNEEWLRALAPLGTDWHKPYIEDAPYLIAVFEQVYGIAVDAAGRETQHKHYYVRESVGIAVGLLLASLHSAGLAALTHTPSPMGFLTRILRRPRNERPFVLIPVGYPADGCVVPDIGKKALEEIMVVV
jgi:iodotyrosine deiodinase